MRVLFQNMEGMDLKEYAKKITEGVTQRVKTAAVNLLMGAGLAENDAKFFVDNIESRIPSMKDGMRKYLQGIIRWIVEGQIDSNEPSDLLKVNKLLRVMKNSPAYEFYDENFNGDSFKQVQQTLNIELDEPEEDLRQGSYSIIPIGSFEEALEYKKYAPDWCILNSEKAYDEHTFNGSGKFYFCLREGWKDEKPIPGNNYPYDNYGYSIIAVSVDADGNITSVTSRWNFDDGRDNFLTVAQLREVLGDKYVQII